MVLGVAHKMLNETSNFNMIGEFMSIDSWYIHIIYFIDNQGNNEGIEARYYRSEDTSLGPTKSEQWPTQVIPEDFHEIFIKLRNTYWNSYNNLIDLSQM
jgi:hypothetical protein